MSPAAGGLAKSAPVVGSDAEPTIFEMSVAGRRSYSFRDSGLPEWDADEIVPAQYLAADAVHLTEVSERDLTAHFTRLTHRQYSVDLGAYPLGSCTMKYNPKLCDEVAGLAGFGHVHPSAPARAAQGWLELLSNLTEDLCQVTGMAAVTLQPPAGAAGELTGLLIMRAYHRAHGAERTKVIIPDSAHGTNPASVTLAGYETVTVPTNERGTVDLDALASVMNEDVAGIMLTNPNTLGLFEDEIAEIAEMAHAVGALLYYDGANLNAIVGMVRPGDMGFDIVHMNLHKTFAVPHGGGGPGAGPVGVSQRLVDFLPGPCPVRNEGGDFAWMTPTKSIGRVHGWHGNALALARAYAYLVVNGADGLRRVSQMAVLNANWLRVRLKDSLPAKYDRLNMHEFVATAAATKKDTGVRAFDIAKRLLEYGFHSPTMYFPLIVDEALMLEPTETESPQTLEALAQALEQIVTEAHDQPDVVKQAPHSTPVQRVDEAKAARMLVPTHRDEPPAAG